jgi:TPR repeat protein
MSVSVTPMAWAQLWISNRYCRAVALGDRYAQKHLGDMYKYGRGVAQSEAVRLYRLSAELGYRGEETALGLMVLEGRGAPMDRTDAVELFKRAAAQEEPEAMEQLRRLSTK